MLDCAHTPHVLKTPSVAHLDINHAQHALAHELQPIAVAPAAEPRGQFSHLPRLPGVCRQVLVGAKQHTVGLAVCLTGGLLGSNLAM